MDDYAFDDILFSEDEFYYGNTTDEVATMIDKFLLEKNSRSTQKKRGRPRKHFTKAVTMVRMECFGPSIMIKAGRGRPAKHEKRVEISVPRDFEVSKDAVYLYTNGRLEVVV